MVTRAKAFELFLQCGRRLVALLGRAGEFEARANYGMSEELITEFQRHPKELSDWLTRATALRQAVQDADLRVPSVLPQTESLQKTVMDAGYLARIFIPLLGADRIVGALVVRRKTAGEFPESTIDLLQTFAAQSALAIQNARLFNEIQVKSQELEVASQHKSQFLANMSHELRTPLNAILGYTELILDSIYGEAPEQMRSVLERVQNNGKHLLGLINDVLDLSKIEAGQLTLSLEDYSIRDVVHSVFSVVEPLAVEKHLELKVELPNDLPLARGDLTDHLVGGPATPAGKPRKVKDYSDGARKATFRRTASWARQKHNNLILSMGCCYKQSSRAFLSRNGFFPRLQTHRGPSATTPHRSAMGSHPV
jgi:signal transduction histidine kinase